MGFSNQYSVGRENRSRGVYPGFRNVRRTMKISAIAFFCRPSVRHRKNQSGLTLVEIMVSMTMGLIVLLAVGSVYLGSRQTYRTQEDNARLQEAGRYALEIIGRTVRQAGASAEMNFNNVSMPLKCEVTGVCTPIAGTNGAGSASDTLVVQSYAGREELSGGVWVSRDCTGGAVAANAVMSSTFELNTTNLRCTGGVGGVQPLIGDVEDLQVVYGVDVDPQGTPGYQSVDRYVAAPTAAEWPQVITARVCVQIRSPNNGVVNEPQRFLNCAGALGVVAATQAAGGLTDAADRRLHRSFVATYNLRNRVTAAP